MTMTDNFEVIGPNEDVTKRPGFAWVDVDHHVIDREDGIFAVVPVRCCFVGQDGNIVATPAAGLNVETARRLAAIILENAKAAELEARAAAGDAEAAAEYDELRKRWDNDSLTRIYGN
jgi:phage major head subunit gpT-like protein